MGAGHGDPTQVVAEYLAGFKWQGYVILTFGYEPSPEGMQKAIGRWYDELRTAYPWSFIFYSADRGPATGHWNVHVLVGGLFAGKPPAEPHRALAITRALDVGKRLWRHGQVPKAVPYDPRGGAPTYLAQYWDEAELPATILGDPIRKSHHRGPGE